MIILEQQAGISVTPKPAQGAISRNWITLDTSSIHEPGAEPVPPEIVRDLLRYAWIEVSRLPQPEIHIKDDTTIPGEQMHLDRTDFIVIGETGVVERQHGHTYEFKDADVTVPVEIHTKHSRQRLYDLMAEVRRIIYTYQRAIRPYQQLYYDRFDERSEGQHNYWQGVCTVRLTNVLVPIISGIVTGFETPSRPNAAVRVPQRHTIVTAPTVEEIEEPVPPDRADTADLF